MEVTLVGTGMGDWDTLTLAGWKAMEQAELLVGARRLVEGLPPAIKGRREGAVLPDQIAQLLRQGGARRACVLLSGDTGFYSGARGLLPLLDFCQVKVVPGIASPQYLAARLGVPWQDFTLVSAHGVERDRLDPAGVVRRCSPVFFLTGGQWTVQALCRHLAENGLGQAQVTVGERLSYPEERLTTLPARQAAQAEWDTLSVALVQAPPEGIRRTCVPGIPDEAFLRGKAPMTKSEVRAVSLSKLALEPEDTLWDVGAGTGSVAVEAALLCPQGQVYAVECQPEAFALLEQNKAKFGAGNLHPVLGMAPQALEELPPPQAVFIGGSKGNLQAILQAALAKNPRVRVVMNAIALETLGQAAALLGQLGFERTEIVQVAVSRAKQAGPYHMMMGQNPVFILRGEGGAHD